MPREDEISLESNHVDKIIEKVKTQNINRGWNDENETLIVNIGHNAASYQILHEASAKYYNNLNNILKILLIVISSILSALVTIYQDCVDFTDNIKIIRNILTYIVNILTILIHFLHFQKLSVKHYHTASEYSKLYHDIQQQMCLFRRDRLLAVKYVYNIIKKYDNIKSSAPDINLKTINTLKKKY